MKFEIEWMKFEIELNEIRDWDRITNNEIE